MYSSGVKCVFIAMTALHSSVSTTLYWLMIDLRVLRIAELLHLNVFRFFIIRVRSQ